MREIEIGLQDPAKALKLIVDQLHAITDRMVDEGLIAEKDQQTAADGITTVLPDLLKFTLRFSEVKGKQSASVIIRLIDDAGATTLMRQAALEAVRLPPANPSDV